MAGGTNDPSGTGVITTTDRPDILTGVENGDADEVTVRADDREFRARVRLDTPREREYLRHGGILPYVLRKLLAT